MKTKTINLYQFSELSDEAKEKAIYDHIEFEISEIGCRYTDEELNPYWKYAKEMEEQKTPWFLHELIYEKEKQSIIETIKINQYDFDKEGNLI